VYEAALIGSIGGPATGALRSGPATSALAAPDAPRETCPTGRRAPISGLSEIGVSIDASQAGPTYVRALK